MMQFHSIVYSMRLFLWLSVALIVPAADTQGQSSNEESLTPEAIQFFETKIRPVLVEHCYRCHSNDGQGIRGGLMVDSREGLRGGGESGPSVVPGSLDDSLLWSAINFEGFEMPPRKQLPQNIIDDFKQWILMGAPDPRTGDVEVVQTKVTPEAIEAGRKHWAFQAPKMPVIPATENRKWPVNDIDRLVAARHEEAGLTPVADSDAFSMIRRLYFDLVGLPPAPEDVDRFTSAWSSDPTSAITYEINRLLASPQYGERWGRHWLDVARFAESAGKEVDMTFPHAWRYRDYVIDSFNQDKPYDEFILQQVAGDLIKVDNDQQWAENLIATGFLAIGPKTLIERNPRQFKADLVDEQIDVTTRVVLGLSVACARCHDHKFDPIPQSDYYAIAGIFQSTNTMFGGFTNQRVRQGSNLIILPANESSTASNAISAAELQRLKNELKAKEQEKLAADREQIELIRTGSGNRTEQETQRIRARALLLERDYNQLQQRINQYGSDGKPLALCMGAQDVDQPTDTRLLVRGEINQPAQTVPRGFVQVICNEQVKIPSGSSGRLELAKWLTSKDNPLTARVMVNRIWLHLMGSPLVAETDNFGRSGSEPTNPELLDYLAIRFMENGWSVKDLIRDIASSRTYRLSTVHDQQLLVLDPNNDLLLRANPRRLEAEAIRDAMLAAAGNLDLDRPDSSAIANLGTTVLGPGGIVAIPGGGQNLRQRPEPLSEISATYRSVYLPVSRNAVHRSMEVFDFAEPTMVVGQREESNTATQSLYLLNNELVIQQSELFAERVIEETETPIEAVRRAFVIAYGRMPTVEEFRAATSFLKVANADRTNSVTASSNSQPPFEAGNRFRNRMPGGQNRPGMQAILERMRQQNARNTSANQTAMSPMAQFCQALFASAEFRYLD